MPPCPCPARALLNIRAVRLCEKRKMMATARDAKDLARGIARADWLQFSSEKQKQKRRDREKGKTHPPIRGAGRAPTHTTTNSHPKSLPKTRTNSLTQTQRTLIFITIIWLFYHTQSIHDITTFTSSLSLLRPSFSIQEAQNLPQHCEYTNLSVPFSLFESSLCVCRSRSPARWSLQLFTVVELARVHGSAKEKRWSCLALARMR